MKEQLTQVEIVKIEQFCKDEVLLNAVRKVLLAGIYTHGVSSIKIDGKDVSFTPDPLVNGAFSLVQHATGYPIPNEILGEQLRAQWQGVNALKNAFDELKKIKNEETGVESPYNPAI